MYKIDISKIAQETIVYNNIFAKKYHLRENINKNMIVYE